MKFIDKTRPSMVLYVFGTATIKRIVVSERRKPLPISWAGWVEQRDGVDWLKVGNVRKFDKGDAAFEWADYEYGQIKS